MFFSDEALMYRPASL